MGKKIATSDYVHLHNHTQYSLLDGLTKLPDLLDFVADSGMQAVAMTDHGTLSGAIEFYKLANSKNIKPIIGIETYIASRKHTDKDPVKDKQRYHLILLAMNNTGYQNLMKLSTIANLDGYYYFPRIDHDLLEQYNEGVIALSACMGGELGDALKNGQYESAKQVATWYKKMFKDRYYLEIQDHGHPDNPLYNKEQGEINNQVLQIGKELDIKVVVTCDAHYLKHEDQDAHEVLLCVGTGSLLSDEKRMSLKEFPLHVTDPNEIIERWGTEHPEVITNTKEIADRCDVSIKLGEILIPKFPVPKNETEKSYLHKLVYQGLAWRYGNQSIEKSKKLGVSETKKTLPENIVERASYELNVIDSMGFNGYFLIISDFINWGKNQGIVFGPGRGSAAGSIIAFALRVTELDPMQYDLLFERFLNPDRISMPDVDIDIQDTRRDEVIQYCVEKYGSERVANIVTFGRMAARNAVRDTARVLNVPYADADRLAKMIPPPVQGRHIPLKTSLEENFELKAEYQNNPTAKQVFDLAMQLEGTIRSHGVHAAGVVIAPDDIVKFAPLERAQKGVISTQYSMGPIEELGLLKMDFLGLSNLSIIKNTLRIIKKVHGKDIDIDNLPLDDGDTFKLLQAGDTTGVFQLESAGMKRYLKELKPTQFEDVVAMVALYRPGPMQFIDEFIGRKRGTMKIEYPHPSMENSLKNTYGVLVYQEQVMQISKEVCGFSGGEADTLRKAIGKKNAELMAKMKDKMIIGGQKQSGISKVLMEKFWKQLEDFAAYCFNKSHAACYGLIAYQTAYLKAHYPSAFMAALMTSAYGDTDRLAIEIKECSNMGIEVLQPDVNESFLEFAVVPDTKQIRFGMSAIKNVGTNAVEEILRVRQQNGNYKTIDDFFANINPSIVNRKNIESLIKAGAFDSLADRLQLLDNLDLIMAFASKIQKDQNSGQTDLFGNLEGESARPELTLGPIVGSYNSNDKLFWERELLGLYISQHPLDAYKDLLSETTVAIKQIKPSHDSKVVTIGGSVIDAREIVTKSGQKMAFIQLTNGEQEIELIVFPSVFQQTLGIWNKDAVVVVKGKVSAKDKSGVIGEEVKIIVDEARQVTLEQAQAYQPTGRKKRTPKESRIKMKVVEASIKPDKKLYIRLHDASDNTKLIELKEIMSSFKGDSEVILVLGKEAKKQAMKLPFKVDIADNAIGQLKQLVGEDNVAIK